MRDKVFGGGLISELILYVVTTNSNLIEVLCFYDIQNSGGFTTGKNETLP